MPNDVKYYLVPGGKLPVIDEVDIIIAGGTIGSIAAASKAARLGVKVFVIGYLTYMGEDICGTYKYLFENHTSNHALLGKLFPADMDRTPFTAKKVLENELLDNNINFLYSSYVTDVLFNDKSEPAGVIITNRSGRQVIRGKVIIDATVGAYVAKMAGAGFINEIDEESQKFQFITVGKASDIECEKRKFSVDIKNSKDEYHAYEYTLHYPMKEWTYPSICNAEQEIRGKIWDADQVDTADHFFFIPPFKIQGIQTYKDDPIDMKNIPIEAFASKNIKYLYILGSCADVKRSVAADMLKPSNLITIGEIVGEASAYAAKGISSSLKSQVRKIEGTSSLSGTVHIGSALMRLAIDNNSLYINDIFVPVIGEYDVVVVGGGTAGANAGISAARHNAKTLVIEYLHGLGGIQTMGRVCTYWDGFREGFTKEIDEGVSEMAPEDHPCNKTIKESRYNINWKTEWYRTQIRKAGGDIWFGVMGCGAVVDKGIVKGVLVATPEGMGIVLAHVVIDSTGSGDIAIAAGAKYEYTDAETFAVQGAGLPFINIGDNSNNTDWTFIDDSDVFDITRLFVSGKSKYENVYDIGKLPQTRERRRIVGGHTVSVLDVVNHRRYRDTISFHMSSFDTHGYTIDPFFTISPPLKRHVIYDADVPLRSLLPQGLENIIVTGLGVSAHRDAMPVLRMQPCLQNQGYSVGYISTLAARGNCTIRELDIKKVQKYLVEKEILPKRVLTDVDCFPFSDEEFKEAAAKLPHDMDKLQILLTDTKKAEELLIKLYLQSEQKSEKEIFAQVLCMLANGIGVQYIIDSVRAYADWDEGWNFTGMGQFGPCMSKLDSLIIALGESKREDVLPVILEKAKMLTPNHALSHFRAVALACSAIGSPAAAQVLSDLLEMQSVAGHHVTTLQQARNQVVPSKVDVTIRNMVLREIYLACALYKCGDDDKEKGAKILKNYSNDLHGHYFRHAISVLKAKV